MPRASGKEVLRRALEHLRPRGAWIQGMYGTASRHCAVGAVRCVLITQYGVMPGSFYSDPLYRRAVERLFRALGGKEPVDVFDAENALIVFNDRKSRRKRDVIALFERALEVK